MIKEFSISVGGSTIVPEHEVRTPFLRKFSALLKNRVDDFQQRTAIVTGGGGPTRMYQKGLRDLGVTDSFVLDTIGIGPTHLNAMLVSSALNHFGIRSQYVRTLTETIDPTMDAWVTGGTTPGHTSDAVLLDFSRMLGIQTLINATNTKYVYEMNNGQIDTSRPIEDMTWMQYLDMIGPRGHQPGENLPFGYTASVMANDLGLTVVVLDGNNLDNLNALFEGKEFMGTVIHPDHQ